MWYPVTAAVDALFRGGIVVPTTLGPSRVPEGSEVLLPDDAVVNELVNGATGWVGRMCGGIELEADMFNGPRPMPLIVSARQYPLPLAPPRLDDEVVCVLLILGGVEAASAFLTGKSPLEASPEGASLTCSLRRAFCTCLLLLR